jgi:nicotinamidase-related amidase
VKKTLPALLILSVAVVSLPSLAQQAPKEDTMPRARKNVINLPWHMYRHYPADFSQWDMAAAGFKGWDSQVRDLDLSKTCLALMHFPDTGLTPDTEFGPDCPNPNALGTIEWIPRTMEVVTFRMPPLLRAARAAGLLVAHVGVGGPPYTQGPIWEKCVKEAGDPPPEDKDVIERDQKRWAQHTRDVFDLPRPSPEKVPPHEKLALPPELLPQGNDIIAQHPWQLHRLLKNRGVDHIIYCGWALNWCLWFSPCGMCDMDRKGYMCSAVRGGCVAIENRESAAGEKNLEYAYWKTSTMFGYIFDLHELTTALRQCAAAKQEKK